jgi:hypothetical protein
LTWRTAAVIAERRGENFNLKNMKITLIQEIEFEPVILFVRAGVRYWEDGIVNGIEDTGGTLIPFRLGDIWTPEIALDEGRILNWPQGTTAKIHYKVCDAGKYWVGNLDGRKAKWKGDYVPDKLLCWGDTGYGDYIIMSVESDGKITGWENPEIDPTHWELLK